MDGRHLLALARLSLDLSRAPCAAGGTHQQHSDRHMSSHRRTTVSSVLLGLLAGSTVAFEPSYVSDSEAEKTHEYLRRVPHCVAAKERSGPSGWFPSKVLHQIWWQGEAEVPAHFHALRATWVAHHPDWTIKLWDEASVTALIDSAEYEWFAPTFHALPSKIQKVDAARFVVLHAEGGVYADLDIEAFQPLDEVLDAEETAASFLFFEEPPTHWKAHNTVISNGLMAAPPGHTLLLRMLKAIRPVADVFQSGGSHMLQAELERCVFEEQHGMTQVTPACGCYVTKSSRDFFPLHDAMRLPEEFSRPGEHADYGRALLEDVAAKSWPPSRAYTAQYWTVSWVDPDKGKLFLDALAAARAGNTDQAEAPLLASIWSSWGHLYKYRSHPQPPFTEKAEWAFQKAIQYAPHYPFAYYELGNLQLEYSGKQDIEWEEKADFLQQAEEHYAHAVQLQPSSMLFVNNLGVSRLNRGKFEEAIPTFASVLDLQGKSFATIKGLDPEAGARLNLGHALYHVDRKDEAYPLWREALRTGSYDYAVQAVQRLKAAGPEGEAFLPSSGDIQLRLAEALASSGRSREASLRYAKAYMAAPKVEVAGSSDGETELTEEGKELRAAVEQGMEELAMLWDEGEGRVALPKRKHQEEDITVVEATADGVTKKVKKTPQEIAKMHLQENAKHTPS